MQIGVAKRASPPALARPALGSQPPRKVIAG